MQSVGKMNNKGSDKFAYCFVTQTVRFIFPDEKIFFVETGMYVFHVTGMTNEQTEDQIIR